MKVAIGLPHLYDCGKDSEFNDALVDLRVTSILKDIEIVRISTYRESVTFARNVIASRAYKADCDYLLFLDDDMVFPADMLLRLIGHNVDVVSALTFLRGEPHEPSFFELTNDTRTYKSVNIWKSGALVECDGVGMACTLIKRSVLDKLKDQCEYHKDIWGFYDNADFLGEDLRFCYKAKQAGFKIYCDTDIVVGHLVRKEIKIGDYKAMTSEKLKSMIKHMEEKKYEEDRKKGKSTT